MSRTLNRHHAHVVWPGDVADEHILDACARAYRIGMEDLLASFAVDHGVVGRHAQEFGKQVFIEGSTRRTFAVTYARIATMETESNESSDPVSSKTSTTAVTGGPHNA